MVSIVKLADILVSTYYMKEKNEQAKSLQMAYQFTLHAIIIKVCCA